VAGEHLVEIGEESCLDPSRQLTMRMRRMTEMTRCLPLCFQQNDLEVCSLWKPEQPCGRHDVAI